MIARDVMTANPLTVTPEASVAEVWDLMREVDVLGVRVEMPSRGVVYLSTLP